MVNIYLKYFWIFWDSEHRDKNDFSPKVVLKHYFVQSNCGETH